MTEKASEDRAAGTALVTGASSGIGRSLAERLSESGYRVYGAGRTVEDNCPAGVIPLKMDVDSDESVRRGIARILEQEGGIEICINAAGFGIAGAVEDTSIEEAKAQFETNFFGTVRVLRSVLPAMREQRSGLIVNISSLAGLTGLQFQGFYSAGKYAIEGLTESLRMEVAPFGIRTVLIEPGDFATGFTSKRRRTADSLTNDAYRERCNRSIAQMEKDEQNGPSPEIIAELLERILNDPTPRLRYMTGPFIQRFGMILKRFLPHKVYEALMTAIYGK